MDDTDLKALQDVAVPEPCPGARTRARDAALTAFDAAQTKPVAATQGNRRDRRLMAIFVEPAWRWIMERQLIVGTVAASLLVVPVTAHLMWNDRQGFARFGQPALEAPAPQPATGQLAGEKKPPAHPPTADAEQFEDAPQPARRQELVYRRDADGRFSMPDAALPQPAPAETAAPRARTEAERGGLPAKVAIVPQGPPTGRDKMVVDQLGNATFERSRRAAGSTRKAERAPGQPKQKPKQKLIYGRVPHQGGMEDGRAEPSQPQNRDRFKSFDTNPVKSVARHPVSTFSIDVDTASYAFVRRSLQRGQLPPPASVRVEEMINYFSYDYPRPESAATPFKASVAVYPTPWNTDTKLLHIGIKGHEIAKAEKPRSNLVFLIDVSGSMTSQDKLPLLKSAFRLLVERLEPEDSVAIVTYAGRAGTALEPTKVKEKRKILAALGRLQSGGSTAGAQGIRQAYALAEEAFDEDGVNRVILATDGDFNVGIADVGELKRYIEGKRKTGIFLSVLGFGQGNYNDALMQALAQNGNGNAAYIDTLREAQKVLVDEAGATLFPIAKDVKIQIEFNPALVSEYRLIGYETRSLRRQDFNNDRIDAGDIGSGHTVTAIYEITPADSPRKSVDDLRYARAKAEPKPAAEGENANEYAFLKLRYKLPAESVSKLITMPITKADAHAGIDRASADMRFAASVAAFGQKLRGDDTLGDFGYDDILALAASARGKDAFGYRGEFLTLVRLAQSLSR